MTQPGACPCPVCRALDAMFPMEGEQLPLWAVEQPPAKAPVPRLAGHYVRRRG